MECAIEVNIVFFIIAYPWFSEITHRTAHLSVPNLISNLGAHK